jgi:hypothetical protein
MEMARLPTLFLNGKPGCQAAGQTFGRLTPPTWPPDPLAYGPRAGIAGRFIQVEGMGGAHVADLFGGVPWLYFPGPLESSHRMPHTLDEMNPQAIDIMRRIRRIQYGPLWPP